MTNSSGSFSDRTLTCADCGNSFTFTAGEQKFFHEKGFTSDPKRCEDCRKQKKAANPRGRSERSGGGGNKPKFPATCSRCGIAFDAPFEPKPDRAVLCRDCFKGSRG